MGSIDAVLLTLINVVACLALPKLIFTILAFQTKTAKTSLEVAKPQTARIANTSFPYCTAYTLTGSQFCRFSPHFCSKCSPN